VPRRVTPAAPPTETSSPRPGALPSAADLDGLYVAVGPVGSAISIEGAWTGGFGGELTVARVCERRALAAIGGAAGALRFAERDGGLVWVDALVGTRRLLGIPVGVSGGLAVQVDEVVPPRFGAHATLWVWAGVQPYVRVGELERSGRFVEAGVKIPLPAIRWR
jgi:hypothetical protein